jgi:hypothetical protein
MSKKVEPVTPRQEFMNWAVSRWYAEVANRPLQNIHRRSLDDTWRQVIRYCGGDDVALCGLSHDELLDNVARAALDQMTPFERSMLENQICLADALCTILHSVPNGRSKVTTLVDRMTRTRELLDRYDKEQLTCR